jgi:hypothetical protein
MLTCWQNEIVRNRQAASYCTSTKSTTVEVWRVIAMHLQHETSDAEKNARPELIVVSPMSRALMTSNIAFAHLIDPGGGEGEREGANETPSCKFLAHEGCREKVNGHACNFRRSVQEMKNEFPNVDFSLLQHQHDRLLVLTHERTISCACIARCSTFLKIGFASRFLEQGATMESSTDQAERAFGFMVWLRDRPETEIVVSTHSDWLFALFNSVMAANESSDSRGLGFMQPLRSLFYTGEMRTVAVTYP